MPLSAWSPTGQYQRYFPGFFRSARRVADLPAWISLVRTSTSSLPFGPSTSRAWTAWPAFFTLNSTTPGLLIVVFAGWILNSVSPTLTLAKGGPLGALELFPPHPPRR